MQFTISSKGYLTDEVDRYIEILRDEYQTVLDSIDSLKNENEGLTAENSKLKEKILFFNDHATEISAELAKLQDKNSALSKNNIQLEEENSKLGELLLALKNENNDLKNNSENVPENTYREQIEVLSQKNSELSETLKRITEDVHRMTDRLSMEISRADTAEVARKNALERASELEKKIGQLSNLPIDGSDNNASLVDVVLSLTQISEGLMRENEELNMRIEKSNHYAWNINDMISEIIDNRKTSIESIDEKSQG